MNNSNWKTTVAGVLAAIWTAVEPIINPTAGQTFSWSTEWPHLVEAAVIAAIGVLAKDYDVTGAGSAKTRVTS